MDNHDIREENTYLRTYAQQCEDKLRSLADALEDRNRQIALWDERYNEIRAELEAAQDELEQRDQQLADRDRELGDANDSQSQLIEKYENKIHQYKVTEDRLRGELEDQRKSFTRMLNDLNRSEDPKKDILSLVQKQLDDKDSLINQLRGEAEEAKRRCADAEGERDKLIEENYDLRQEKERLEQEIAQLRYDLENAGVARVSKEKLDGLTIDLDKERRKSQGLFKKYQQLKRSYAELMESAKQQIEVNERYENELKHALNDYDNAKREIQNLSTKNGELRRANRNLYEKQNKYKVRIEDLVSEVDAAKKEKELIELQIQEIQNEMLMQNKQKLERIKGVDKDKEKIKQLKLQARQEISRRMDAEELNLDLKEEIEKLNKEIAVLREELQDIQGIDTSPLVDLLKELRLEAIPIDGELQQIRDQIPPESDLFVIEIPSGICESLAVVMARAAAVAQSVQIENRELRLIVQRLVRVASTYHRFVSVIAQYPILSTEDIGTAVDRGNWVLPVETEHLQRTIIKLHELLQRKPL